VCFVFLNASWLFSVGGKEVCLCFLACACARWMTTTILHPREESESTRAGVSREFSDRRKVEREEKREEKCFVKEIHSLVLGWELESQDSLTKLSLSSI
jgi:hypothetical protein